MKKKFIGLMLAAVFLMAAAPLFAAPALAEGEDAAAGAAETAQTETQDAAGEESEPPAESEEPAAEPAEEAEPRDVTDTLNWLLGVTLTGPDGAALGEDTPPDATCRLAYTFAVPGDAGVHAGDTTAITLPKEISAADGAVFQIIDDGGVQIAAASGDGQSITVTFSGDIPAGTSGAFSIKASFIAENISGENPVQISFPLSLGNAQTIGVDFAGETEESAPAVTAMDAAVMATTHTVSGGQTFDISTCADGDTVLVDAGATATLTGSGHVIVKCGAGVKLTLDSVYNNPSAIRDACALRFTGVQNTLALVGTNTLVSGYAAVGMNIPGGAELTISGSGSLTVHGGDGRAGIGGGGLTTINSGTVKATGGNANNIGECGAGIGGRVIINGGTVTGTGGKPVSWHPDGGGAGIGGDTCKTNSKITINGGTVTATGGYQAAGIGGGGRAKGGSVEITGGTVVATGGYEAAGIGGGGCEAHTDGGTVTVSGGTVVAKGGEYAAGIGGGAYGNGGTFISSGGSVYAVGSSKGKYPSLQASNIGKGGGDFHLTDGTKKNPYGKIVALTKIRLMGSSAGGAEIQSITTDLEYSYGLNGVYSNVDGYLYFYMPNRTKTTEINTSDEDYGGTAVTSDSSEVFNFIVQGKDGREIELRTAGGYIQWRYVGDDNWTNLEALSDITGEDGREIELRSNGTYIQWRYVGDGSWVNLEALADITGSDGADGREEKEWIEEIISVDGEAAVGIAGIAKTGTDGNVDTYTITFTDGNSTTFTVTNGLGGASVTVNESGELIFTLGDGTKINLGDTAQIAEDLVAAGAAEAHYDLQSDEKGAATLWVALAALALALLTFLSHLGIIRLPRRKNG